MSAAFDPEQLPHLLPLYYKRLFPYDQLYRWLNYDGWNNDFQNREFSFELRGGIYIRFQSFYDQNEFVHEVQKKMPEKIDIGAVYNIEPKTRKASQIFIPKKREVVFDIDMTDYDEVRICCRGADICNKCWKFMVVACKILDAALREDFGFKHLLWVFSGRRGIHCWVCDDEARSLSDSNRSCVAEFLQLIDGGLHKEKKVQLPGDKLHTSIKRAIKVIEEYFMPVCIMDQDMLGTPERLEKFLKLFNDEVKDMFRPGMEKLGTSEERWNYFVKHYEDLFRKGDLGRQYTFLKEEIQIQYLYPRLDINVTKGLNHLLKSPFCVHPKSGKVSIPFSPKVVEKFDPLNVPTLNLLVDEINAYDEKTKEQEEAMQTEENEANTITVKRIKDYKKTSLLKPINIFEEFLRGMEMERKKKIEKSDATMEF